MAPSFGSYIVGCLAVIGIVAAVGLGGYWLRRWIVPEFSGALARLADATLAIALLIVSLQILGQLSLLYFGWIVAFCALRARLWSSRVIAVQRSAGMSRPLL